MAGGVNDSGRVSNRELYEALLEQNKERAKLERSIKEELKPLLTLQQQVTTNKEEINRLRARSNWLDLGLGMFTILMTAISNVFGSKQ